jgi:hypothetical protein
MNLRAPKGFNHKNIEVIRTVSKEFNGKQIVSLNRDAGVEILVWNKMADGKTRSLFTAIPRDWLVDPQNIAKLEETKRNFANCISEASDS